MTKAKVFLDCLLSEGNTSIDASAIGGDDLITYEGVFQGSHVFGMFWKNTDGKWINGISGGGVMMNRYVDSAKDCQQQHTNLRGVKKPLFTSLEVKHWVPEGYWDVVREFIESFNAGAVSLDDDWDMVLTPDSFMRLEDYVNLITYLSDDNNFLESEHSFGEVINNKPQQIQKENKMSKINSIVSRTQSAAMSAAEYQAGKAINAAVVGVIKPQLPMFVRGYADHVLAPVAVALMMAAASEYMPDSPSKKKVVKLSDMMLKASMMDGADKMLDIESLVAKVLGKLPAEAKAFLENE